MTPRQARGHILWVIAMSGLGVYLLTLFTRTPGSLVPWSDVWLANLVLLILALLAWRPTTGVRSSANRWLGIAIGVYAMGNTAYYLQAQLNWQVSPSSLADIGYLAFYPAVLVSLAALQRASGQRLLHNAEALLDIVISAFGTATIAAFAFGPMLHEAMHGAGGWTQYLIGLAYPIADLLLIGCLAAALAGSSRHPSPGLTWIIAGLLAFSLGDYIYTSRLLSDSYIPGQPVDATWMIGCTIIAWGAGRLHRPARSVALYPTWLLPFAGALIAIFVLFVAVDGDRQLPARLLAVATLLVSLARWAIGYRNLEHMATLHQQAHTDELTGLCNRRGFFLAATDRFEAGTSTALALIDLDGLKVVNDTLGHPAGDAMLLRAARSMVLAAGPEDLVARLGGDEFVIAFGAEAGGNPDAMARQLADAIEHHGAQATASIPLRVSVGVALHPADGADIDRLLRVADERMYAMKQQRVGGTDAPADKRRTYRREQR